MIWKITILLSFALCVLGDGHHAVSEQYIKINDKQHHGDITHIGSKKPEHHEEYAWSYPSYEFSYSVNDPHTHDKKGQHESRDGDEVKGEYWLVEPDGRKRTVTYHADKHSGFHAIVHYSDKHHHMVENHDHKSKEDVDEKGAGGDQGQGGEEDQVKIQEENKGGNDEAAGGEEGSEEARGGEESQRLDAGEVGWGYGPKWDHTKKEHQRGDHKRGRGEGRGCDEDRSGEEDRRDEGHKGSDVGKHDEFSSLTNYGSWSIYGRRDNKKKDEGRKHNEKHDEGHSREEKNDENEGRDREESLLWEQRRKFDERRGYPSHVTPYSGHASRINPRFYRHNQKGL